MRKFTYDNENIIMLHFRDNDCKVLAIPLSEILDMTYRAVKDDQLWMEWIDSSSKSSLPPDFFNEKQALMMEVMRFDDQQTVDGNIHATKKKEAKMMKDIKDSGLLDSFQNLESITINAVTDLETNADHNFNRYRGNFNRVVTKHANKVYDYRSNHPGYKLIFFVFDETSGMYFETPNQDDVKIGKNLFARAHCHWLDETMLNTVKKCGADFLIWYKPHSSFETPKGINDNFPKIIMFDIENMKIETVIYNATRMISSEI